MSLGNLPDEVVEQIYAHADPQDFVALSSSCHRYHDLLHKSDSQFVWRSHFLQRFDDPRLCVDRLGERLAADVSSFNWKGEFQRRIRVQSVILNPHLCREDEVPGILRTLVSLIVETPPATPTYDASEISKNLLWLSAQHALGEFFHAMHQLELSQEDEQYFYYLHVLFGLTPEDLLFEQLVRSRGFVYDLRNHTQQSRWGPYRKSTSRIELDDDMSAKVNWRHIFAIQNIVSEHVAVFEGEGEERKLRLSPLSLPFCQAHVSEGPRHKDDWAGVDGLWKCSFCFIDHRELLAYNRKEVADEEERDMTMFDDPDFEEVFRFLDVRFTVTGTTANPLFPTRPTISFSGDIRGIYMMKGTVSMTAEREARWKFSSGENGNLIWSSDGVQIGSVESAFGVLGTWSTVFHEAGDPVGPFWLRKVHRPSTTDTEDERHL
ncbi:hypothetical protein SCHPADRAFT_946739 [Schizopora paradoxa]|uniref:F-box domain-containing protein n=1 Tax=Schizopora paradoxa TaxID=27342 RepID=A0A0H2R1N0_9AGAM|nr:hypothetical protein SCHPADRAFT_946739 [Schizopora paradoxa]